MKVTIFGSGYVGLVTGACLADVGHEVMCVDVDETKIEKLKQGIIPIFEPGLDAIVVNGIKQGTLHFTTDVAEGVAFADIQFIAVGTPPDEDGSADLQYVLAVAESIGEHMTVSKTVVNKSTVPVGTSTKVTAALQKRLDERGVKLDFDVCSNPEFLKEGSAVDDFMKPDRIVVGTENPDTEVAMRTLYEPFCRNHDRMVFMDVRSAELTKYAANAMLATKISFMNEIANLAERFGADIENVRKGIGSDPRIGFHFIYPGCGYGGSCFPKDVQALVRMSNGVGYDAQLLNAVETVNNDQKHRLVEKIKQHFGNDLNGLTFAVWGLSFKPMTDDMRAATSRVTLESLWQAGAKVQAYDPASMDETRRIYGERDDLQLLDDKYEVLKGADALIIHTEWKQFRVPDFDHMEELLKNKVLFDGRNLYDPEKMDNNGWIYYAIGRGEGCTVNREADA